MLLPGDANAKWCVIDQVDLTGSDHRHQTSRLPLKEPPNQFHERRRAALPIVINHQCNGSNPI
jgi:hypothetical protein